MDALRIQGGKLLEGTVEISGAKNACLPILAATVLTHKDCQLNNVPDLVDVKTMVKLIESLGAEAYYEDKTIRISHKAMSSHEAPYELVRTMRASALVLGPLLSRFGRARVSLPGGCAIGNRPLDQHLKGLEKLGAEIEITHGYIDAKANRLVGGEIIFDFPTVGGTENLLLAASLAKGESVLRNCACEPEIEDLADCLTKMGVEISGAGTKTIHVQGKDELDGFEHQVIPDRIEFGTFLIAGALIGKDMTIKGGLRRHQLPLCAKLEEANIQIESNEDEGTIRVKQAEEIAPLDIQTAPYPGFPTDMQAQMMTLLSLANGTSMITETIFENRFMHTPELNRLGADIRIKGREAAIHGVSELSGTTVMATDLRASASLVLAGLVADGTTTIRRIYHLDRGYAHIENKLKALGANIERFKEE
ncbi:MAG: UDP-N-acetylglucosamine 1-carboxyvinyltransferase [Myxococcales bacterium]|nr:UDP-N-acetylglucosamine 1-carboxyvinyltransferase [Myxococcales bacterium]